jgi:hypothetical protein
MHGMTLLVAETRKLVLGLTARRKLVATGAFPLGKQDNRNQRLVVPIGSSPVNPFSFNLVARWSRQALCGSLGVFFSSSIQM